MICALSEKEMLALQTHGLEPSCDNHVHVTYREALSMADQEVGKWVKHGAEARARFMRFRPRVWKARNMAMQLIPGVIQGRAGSFRYPVKANGGRNRNTAVSQTNYDPTASASC